jgi:multicomponent Na+:H+ antiporter subunit G
MDLLLDTLSWSCLLTGSVFAVVGGVGLLRLPDLFTRMHAGGVTDTMGAGLIMSGLIFQADGWQIVVKLVVITFFMLITSPTSGHALAKAALASGLKPMLPGDKKESS